MSPPNMTEHTECYTTFYTSHATSALIFQFLISYNYTLLHHNVPATLFCVQRPVFNYCISQPSCSLRIFQKVLSQDFLRGSLSCGMLLFNFYWNLHFFATLSSHAVVFTLYIWTC